MNKSIYSTPKLCKSNNGWYVHFRYNGVQKRYKQNLNRIKNLSVRKKVADLMIKEISAKLKKGWNPITDTQEDNNNYLFSSCLDFALKKKRPFIGSKTYSGYKGAVKFVQQALPSLGLQNLVITDLKRKHIKLIMLRIKEVRGWSNKAHNKYLNFLRAILSELLEWDILEHNPAYKIRPLKEEITQANRVPTDNEFKRIKSHLKKEYADFFVFVATIFHTGIRPGELLQVTLSMIDLEAQTITLPSIVTKSNRFRIVPINDHLMELFAEMNLHLYPDDFYLFGSYRERGRGNVGKYLDFIPGPTKIKSDTSNKRWRKAIKIELGIDVNLYAMKHAGADAKIRSGIDLDVLRELYGHTSSRMTERYAKAVKQVYRNEIIKRSPRF